MRLPIAGQDGFPGEVREKLRAGLETAPWIPADDIGARHARANGACTQTGDRDFACSGMAASKSRLNCLDLLRAGHADHVVNGDALAHMRHHGLAGPLAARLAGAAARHLPDRAASEAHPDQLGIPGMDGSLGPARIATEGALRGSIAAHGVLRWAVIRSDDAGRFEVGIHALCRVRADCYAPFISRPAPNSTGHLSQ